MSKRHTLALFALLAFHLFAKADPGLRLIENKGQWPASILFKVPLGGGSLYVESNVLTYTFFDSKALHEIKHGENKSEFINCHAVKVRLEGAAMHAIPLVSETCNEYYNFFIGKNPAAWSSHVQAYRHVLLQQVYPGIDMELLANGDQLKYNFIVHPGADPSKIQLVYEGQTRIALTSAGSLEASTTLQTIIEHKPVAAYAGNAKRSIGCNFVLQGNRVRFDMEDYDRSQTLIIDPEVVFATFSGSTGDNFGYTATFDDAGNTYSGGTVYDVGFPTTPGAFQTNYKGGPGHGTDVGILKYTPDGKSLVYATYLGGGAQDDQPHSMVVNSLGQLVVMGTTAANDFPSTNNAYDKGFNGSEDIFISVLSADGSALIGSSYFGDTGDDGLNGPLSFAREMANGPLAYNYGDHYRGEVLVDKNDNIHIISSSHSMAFRTTALSGAVNHTAVGDQYAVYACFSPNAGTLQKVAFFGGSGFVSGFGLAFDATQSNLYVCGGTNAVNMPLSPTGYQKTYGGGIDGYLLRMDVNTLAITASTFWGTSSYDQTYFVQVADDGQVFVTGQSTSDVFPVTSGTYKNDKGKLFISSFSSDLKQLTASTVIGNGESFPPISPSAFLVDKCGQVCLSGWGGTVNIQNFNSETGTTFGLPTTQNAAQQTTDGSDFYVLILSPGLKNIVYGSFFGGPQSDEHVDGGTSRFDHRGIIYQSVCGGCGGFSDFPTTPGAWSQTNNGHRPGSTQAFGCNNAVFKINLNTSLYPPKFRDTLLTVYALDVLKYNFTIYDPDPADSIFVTYTGSALNPASTNANPATISSPATARQNISGSLTWNTTCANATPDTFVIVASIHDNACPGMKFTTGAIKIVVLPVPVIHPPELSCIKSIDPNTTEVIWTADKTVNMRFFKKIVMDKMLPDESIIAPFKQFFVNTDDSLSDPDAPSHKQQDFCYYLYGINTCNVHSDTTRYACTKLYPDTAQYNPFDMAVDTVLHVIATDSLVYHFDIHSKKPRKHTIHVEYTGELLGPGNKSVNAGSLVTTKGVDVTHGVLKWKAECADMKEDTFSIYMLIWDNACPMPNSRTNRIHVRVLPPPPPQPPTMYCVKRIDPNTLRIRWAFGSTDKYFAYNELVRKDSTGKELLLGRYFGKDTTNYLDPRAVNWFSENYCYFMYGVNICGIRGPNSLGTCSEIDSSFAPAAIDMNYVSVVGNKNIEVNWQPSKDTLAESYKLYRMPNLPGKQFGLYHDIALNRDTFTDTKVNVSQTSYCYRVNVLNECGVESGPGKPACTIVLKGASGTFEHYLNWTPYTWWNNGVFNHSVMRSDPFLPEKRIGKTNWDALNYKDDQLYDDCGLYRYRVVAHEYCKTRQPFESSSNTIELLQQPLVFAPTAFTPNEDGLNETWGIVPSFVKDFRILIYNRWGEKIFESQDTHFSFNGSFNGSKPEDNIYAYVISCTGWDDKLYHLSGTFTRMR